MHPLNRLLNDNKHTGQFKAEASGNETTLYIYDSIVSNDMEAEYYGGVSPQMFGKALKSITSDVIHLRINSPGGDVFAARSMEQALKEHPARVVAHIDGYAASAASFLAMAADEVVISEGGFIMIHNAWTIAFGNANDLMNTAALLEKIDNTLVNTYAARTGQALNQIAEWMAAETWFDANEALAAGFVDSIADGVKVSNEWNLSAYAHAPEMAEKVTDNVNSSVVDEVSERVASGEDTLTALINTSIHDAIKKMESDKRSNENKINELRREVEYAEKSV